MTAEVRTTVDEKIINKMSEPTEKPIVEEPIKDEIQNEEPKITQDDVSIKSDYDDGSAEDKVKDTKVEDKDEYGNEVAPKKVYTEEEVNELIRQRFNRTKKEEELKQVQQPQQKQNELSDNENWETQLEGFVENTFKKLTVREHQKIKEAKESEAIERLQQNIHNSMNKYKDFREVVGQVPMSDYMVKATKSFKDPGAFIYAASKTQRKELERIAQLDDALDQAAEIGKLEERMRKIRSGTNSPRPVSGVKGDIENKSYVRQSVDDLVRKDALKKLSRRN